MSARKPVGNSSFAKLKFKTPEARAEYFDQLGEACRELDAIGKRGTVLNESSEPAWMRTMLVDDVMEGRNVVDRG